MKPINEFLNVKKLTKVDTGLLEMITDSILNTDGDKWYISDNIFNNAFKYNHSNDKDILLSQFKDIIKYLNDNKIESSFDVYGFVGKLYEVENLYGFNNRLK